MGIYGLIHQQIHGGATIAIKQENGESAVPQKVLLCQLCNYKASTPLAIIRHIKTPRHTQIEQIYCLQRRCENIDTFELADIIQCVEGEFIYCPN